MNGLQLNPNLLQVPLYIAGKSVEEVEEELGLGEVTKLGSNENPLGPSPLAVAAAQQALQEAHRYPNHWEKVLRRKLAAHLDPQLSDQHLLIGNGGCDVLRMVMQGFTSEGSQMVTASATFPMFSILTTMFGGQTVTVPLTADYRFDLPGLMHAITPQTRLAVLCTPNNPTGAVITQAEADAFMAGLPDHVLAVFDESYIDFCAHPDHVRSLGYILAGRNVISVRSFSKSAGLANLRVGYAIGRPDLIEYLHHTQMPFNTGSVALAAAAGSLDDADYRRRSNELMRQERQYLYAALDELDLDYLPSEANFVLLVNLPLDARRLVDGVLRQGVIIRWAGSMGLTEAARITLGTRDENERCVNALRTILVQARAGDPA